MASAAPRRDSLGRIVGAIAVFEDVTQEHRLQQQVAASDERLRTVYAAIACGVVVLDSQGEVVDANQAAQQILGLSLDDLRRLGIVQLRRQITDASGDPLSAPPGRVAVLDLREPARDSLMRLRRADGQERWLHLNATPVLNAQGHLEQVVLSFLDTTDRVRAEQELRHQMLHDALTGLANRTLFHDRLTQELDREHHPPQDLALLLLDLDHFKDINDAFGHDQGDLLLQEVARRVRGTLPATDLVARLGGDEFAVLLPGVGADGALRVMHTITTALAAPIAIGSYPFHVVTSAGIVVCPDHGQDAQTLLRRAEVAMYAAKRAGDRYRLYSPEQDRSMPTRLALIEELRQAIARDQLVLFYQPIVDMTTQRIECVEALVRWHHPERGLVPPDSFIPLAEQTGLIKPLTQWVLQTALRQLHVWRERGLVLDMSVNLSMTNLHDPELAETIERALARNAIPPTVLRLELTETAIIADIGRAETALRRLSAAGVRIAIDDYGTGYSSLAYLKRLPIEAIKIDKSFVQRMLDDEADAAIVASTIGLGHTLGLRVVAEGVEREEMLTTLVNLHCDAVQGYYLGRPLPAQELEQWLATRVSGPGVAAGTGTRPSQFPYAIA
jgi:diguanylate cyclase (GGDEF)-like protein/PAS domain S-box-containing protein